MKERPILFNSEMIRAILNGRKTQTRRLKGLESQNEHWRMISFDPKRDGTQFMKIGPDENKMLTCPYGQHGDRLWVRETWRPWSWHEGEPIVIQFKADMKHRECWTDGDEIRQCEWEERMWIQITDELTEKGIKPDEYGYYHFDGDPPLRWHPSIHMPRWASRIALEITEIRIERLQDISLEDIYAEGIRNEYYPPGSIGSNYSVRNVIFPEFWDSINAKRGFPWKSNPWVWVINFSQITKG